MNDSLTNLKPRLTLFNNGNGTFTIQSIDPDNGLNEVTLTNVEMATWLEEFAMKLKKEVLASLIKKA